LIVSGRDPSGAGIDADLAAASEPWIEAIPIVTAETDQDATRVRSVGARDQRAWLSEALEAARQGASDGGGRVDAIKFGLLPGGDHVRAARDLVRELRRAAGREIPAVVDPVIAASSGGRFLDWSGVEAVRRDLAPCGVVLTPNLLEAAELTSVPLASLAGSRGDPSAARVDAARQLLAMGAVAVVIKGGHGVEDPVRDLAMSADGREVWIEHPRSSGRIRGSGCRFATRLAAGLGSGRRLETSAAEAGAYVAARIARAGEAVAGPRA
jgi:hydroxymethylpyrimidine/phosphomethylpyrimidine kinase